jgi:hypothetical protein
MQLYLNKYIRGDHISTNPNRKSQKSHLICMNLDNFSNEPRGSVCSFQTEPKRNI